MVPGYHVAPPGGPPGIGIVAVWTHVALCGACCMVPSCMLHGTTCVLHVAWYFVTCCMLQSGVGSLLLVQMFTVWTRGGEPARAGISALLDLSRRMNFLLGSTVVPCCTTGGTPLHRNCCCVDACCTVWTVMHGTMLHVAWYHVACCMLHGTLLHVACCKVGWGACY